MPTNGTPNWEDFVIGPQVAQGDRKLTAVNAIKALIPKKAKVFLKRSLIGRGADDPNVIRDRLRQY